MKKIFAIALAAVMVLSMASAFAASDCAVWGNNWPCDVDDNTPWCGQGAVEVVPLVKVNTACGWEYQVNECAGAVRSDEVYYALQLTVDAYPDRDWWTQATITVDEEDFTGEDEFEIALAGSLSAEDTDAEVGQLDMDSKKKVVYYAVMADGAVSAWIDLANDDEDYVEEADTNDDEVLDFKDVVVTLDVSDATPEFCKNWGNYEVCATLASFYDGGSVEGYNKLGDYFYKFETHPGFEDMDAVEDGNDGFEGTLTIEERDDDGNPTNQVTFIVKDGAIVTPNWDYDFDDNDKFYNKVMDDFGFASCGTAACITYLNIQKNFGWNDSQEDCFKWSDKAAAVVDAECVVAIPKTGDASLLAWLF